MRAVIDNRPLSYRYLFFSLIANTNEFNHPKIHISWVKAQGSKEANASPYVLLLDPKANKLKDASEAIDLEKEIDQIPVEYTRMEIPEPGIVVPDDVSMDYALCRYRYLYSYLVNYLPEYTTDFHYSFLLSNMIKAFYSVSGKEKTEITNELFELFPFFRRVELRQAADYTGRKMPRSDTLVFDDAEYSASRLDIHYINPQCKQMAIKAFEGEPLSDEEIKRRCMYCPYATVCIYKHDTNEDDEV